jgi:hypothetical protein
VGWPRCTAGWHEHPSSTPRQKCVPIEAHRVRLDECDVREIGDDVAQRAGETVIDLDGGDRAPVSASAKVSDPRPAPISTT